MATILIRDLGPRVIEALREQAARNGRSMESEVRLMIEEEAQRLEAAGVPAPEPASRSRKRAGRTRSGRK